MRATSSATGYCNGHANRGARKINNFGVLQAAESNEASINSNGARNSYAESSIVSAIR